MSVLRVGLRVTQIWTQGREILHWHLAEVRSTLCKKGILGFDKLFLQIVIKIEIKHCKW